MANKQYSGETTPTIARHFRQFFEEAILLNRSGTIARRLMVLSWLIIASIGMVDIIWAITARIEFAPANWIEIVRTAGVGLLMALLFELIAIRLKNKQDQIGKLLRTISLRLGMATVATVVFAMLAAVVITLCCLTATAALPLRDEALATMDIGLGFHWKAFVALSNANEIIAGLLLHAYQNTGQMVFITMFWLCLSGRSERLAEFIAMLCLTAVGIAIGQLILPAGGAYSFHRPDPEIFSQFGVNTGMWHHELLMQFRSEHPPPIDFTTPNINCLVTFPSGHTILGLVTTYALRDKFYTLVPAATFNGTMIVSTLAVGGHYLTDLIASGGITAISILFIRSAIFPHQSTSASSQSSLIEAA